MKRFLATILSFVLLAGCAQNDAENTIVQRDNGEPFYGSFEDVNATRTYVNEAMTMLWHADDRISLFRSTLNEEFKFAGETGDSAGDFEEIPSEIFVTGAEISTNYGVYPYNSTTTIGEDETITLTMPSVQAYAQNSFGCGANTAVAATENSSSRFLPFRNVGGFLVVKIYSPSGVVKSVELKGNNGEVLAGEATVQAKYGYLPLLTMGDGTDSITLDCGGGVEVGTTEDSATHFWFVVPPTTFESGFTVCVTDTAGAVTTKSTTKRNEISRNEVTVMSAFEIAETEKMPTNSEIWYTNGSTTEPTAPDNPAAFGDATVQSNTYDAEKECWVITFDKEVTEIGDYAFADCSSLTSVTIPDSVTTIGYFAFADCSSLTSVTIPDSVTTIGDFAFFSCTSLTSVTIPGSVTTIGAGAFFFCTSLTSITIPDSVTTIVDGAFSSCSSLTSITIPDGVTSIGEDAFYCCTSLTSITIPDSVTTIVDGAFSSCTSLTSVYCKATTPPTLGDNSVFEDNGSGRKIYVPAGYVESYRISNYWSDYADYIVGYNFENGEVDDEEEDPSHPVNPTNNEIWYTNGSTTGSTQPNTSAFGDATIVSNEYDSENGHWVITFDRELTTIGERAFYYFSSLTSVTIPDSVTTIGDYAFAECTSLTSITIPDSVTTIGEAAFGLCTSLTSVTIPDSVTTIGYEAFSNCYSLTSVTIPDSVTTIGNGAFNSCYSLTSVTIPDSVTTIGEDAFHYCESLTSVTIGDSVTKIGVSAFGNCRSLTSITIPDSVTTIGDWAFSNCYSLTSITIPDSVTTIGDGAFYSCSKLTSVTIPDSVTTIGEDAFYRCRSLTSVTIPDSVTTIGERAFYDCSSLTSVTIPDSVTTIGEGAFAWCDSLTSITIPDGVTSIGDSAFYSCGSLTSITIPDGVTTIGYDAFSNCDSLTSVTIPDSVTEIGDNAFYYCTSLTSVYCKATTPPSGGYYMFYEIASNSKIYVPTDSVVAYKEANGWSDYADYIVGYNFENGEVDDEEEDPSHPANPANSEIWYTNGSTINSTEPHSDSFGDAIIVSNEYDIEKGHWVITFDKEVKEIGNSAFSHCRSLTSITIPDSVTTIGYMAFYYCTSLTSVTIPDSVTEIGDSVFECCTSLIEIIIGKSVVVIGRRILDSCESLRTVYCKPTTPPTSDSNSINFIGCDTTNVTLYVPVESMNSYVNHDSWEFYNDIMAPYNYETGEIVLTSIISYGDEMIEFDEEAFDANIIAHYYYYNNYYSGYRIIFDGVITTIGEGAFYRAHHLTSISIPESVTSIGEGAFADSGLHGIGIPGSVKEIGSNAFAYCQYLTGVSIDKGVTKIGSNAFALCIGLSDITIPDSVTTIGYGAFSQCSRLKKVYCKATTPPSGDSDMFEGNAPGLTIYVPTDSVEAYKKAYGWRDYADAIVGYNF